MATMDQIHKGLAAIVQQSPEVATVLAYPDRPAGTLPCAIVYPGKFRVDKGDGGLEYNSGICQVHILCELQPQKRDGVARAIRLQDSIQALFRVSVLAISNQTSCFIVGKEAVMARYQGKSYGAVVFEVQVVDEVAVTYLPGVVLTYVQPAEQPVTTAT